MSNKDYLDESPGVDDQADRTIRRTSVEGKSDQGTADEGGEIKENRLLAVWEGFTRVGLGETIYRRGTHLLSIALVLIVGEFQETVEQRFDFSFKTGQNYMKLAKELPPILKKASGASVAEDMSVRGGLKLISDSTPKAKRASLLDQSKSQQSVGGKADTKSDEPDDDPNEHVREQIRNEQATGDMNKPPEPDWKGLLDLVGQVRRAADTCNKLTGRKGQFCDQFQSTCCVLDTIVRDWRKATK